MIKLLKKKTEKKNKNFFKSTLSNFTIYYIDKIVKISKQINIKIRKKEIFFKGRFGELSLNYLDDIIIFFFYKKNLLIVVNLEKNKKSILNLYNKLIKIKIKGVLQGFKISLILKGIGFKASIENNNLILKIGYSHNINIPIPLNIKIINQTNTLIFKSIDYIFLTQYVHFIKNKKKIEPYKGKGLLLKNEKFFKKEGKKSKK